MEQSRLKAIIPFPSIRAQLLIISLVVLVLPWIGVQTIRDMEKLLREQQVHNAMTTATTILNGLSPAIPLLVAHNEKLELTPKNSEVILSTLSGRIIIDGYADDWPDDRTRQHYNSRDALPEGKKDTQIAFDLSGFHQSRSLVLLLDISDDQLYQTSNPVHSPDEGDHILLGLGYDQASLRKYIISSNSPGWLSVIPLDNPDFPETRIQAEMQSRSGGYTIEISIPDYLSGHYVSLQVIDRDNDESTDSTIIGNTPVDDNTAGLLFGFMPEIKQQLATYRAPEQQIRLLDVRGNILAEDGEIHESRIDDSIGQKNILDHLHELLLLADAVVGEQDSKPYRMDDDFVRNSLNNQADHAFTRNAQGMGLLYVAVPVMIDNKLAGSLVIQQSTEAISGIRHQALLKIMLTSLSAMAIIVLVLLLYATLLIKRIRALNYQMQQAANDEGQLQHSIRTSLLNDELGELSRGMAIMVDRLQAYQQYLETMASKLSHELRTPLTVVQSSLENLQSESDELNNSPLIERANEGLKRLKIILANLTEASRLENALKTTEVESFNLCAVIEGCVKGYQQAFSETAFEFSSNTNDYAMRGSTDLIAQLLDKLVTNAIDFHTPGSVIKVIINKTKSGCELCVKNTGEPISEHIINTMFDSMVSARTTTTDTPHMGLGLYVVRLIATFHAGTVSVRNDEDRVSVCVLFG